MSSPTVFVTGAAAGIGRATALHFASRGYLVGAFDIDEIGLGRLAGEIETAGGKVHTGVLDVTDDAQWQQRLAEFHQAHGRLDILINNAGILRSGPFEAIDLREQHAMVAVNVDGVISGAHHAFPYLRETTGAQLVNMCSASALYGQPELATYAATKSAVKSLTEALDLEWARHDIRVIAIWPLFVETAMVHGLDTGSTRSLGVRLSAEDVAEGVWSATRRRGRLPRVHYEIGAQAKVLALTAKFSPGWASRAATKFLTRS